MGQLNRGDSVILSGLTGESYDVMSAFRDFVSASLVHVLLRKNELYVCNGGPLFLVNDRIWQLFF